MKNVLIITKPCLGKSETFTYDLINNIKEFNIEIATENIYNNDIFPIKWKTNILQNSMFLKSSLQ